MPPSISWHHTDERSESRRARGTCTAFVIRGNADGSLKLTQSRVVTAEGFEAAIFGVFSSMMLGLIGIRGMLKGVKSGGHAVRAHSAHVGSDEQAVHAILAQAGPNAAVAMVCCDDETRQTVAAHASEQAITSWDGSRSEFLAALEPGSAHDWVRAALGEPASTDG